jgi:general nucleoside transport system ATP-binding protein
MTTTANPSNSMGTPAASAAKAPVSTTTALPDSDVGSGLLAPLVELRNIVKIFPGVRANDGVSFTVNRHEVHGLLGENGAGKSTLMSILYGLYQPEEGTIFRSGVKVTIPSPKAALAAGVAIVQQHFALVPTLSVSDNVILGDERGRWIKRRQVDARVSELSNRYQLDLTPEQIVGTLSIGQRQRVEILKCLYRDPEVLVFDEPTTVLTPGEVEQLFSTIGVLRSEGRGIVLITHKLDELMTIADRVTVLRNGRTIGTVATGDVDGAELARMMVGREVRLRSAISSGRSSDANTALEHVASRVEANAPVVFEVRDLSLREAGVDRLSGVNLTVRKGEIVGLAGVEGNGQRELVAVIAGLVVETSGSVLVKGESVSATSPLQRSNAGLRVVTEDRHSTGCVLDMTVGENLLSDRIGDAPYSRRGIINTKVCERAAQELVDQYRVKTPTVGTEMRSLSGGNQQRAILARELSGPLNVLVASQPTRGLDVGAIEEVTERILSARDGGAGVLLISSDLGELLSLCDRVAVLYRGSIVGEMSVAHATYETLGALMAGLAPLSAGVTSASVVPAPGAAASVAAAVPADSDSAGGTQ